MKKNNEKFKVIKFANFLPIFINKKEEINILSCCLYSTNGKIKTVKDYKLKIDKSYFNMKFLFRKGIKIPFIKIYINFYKIKLNIKELGELPIQNKVNVGIENELETDIQVIYNLIYLKKFIGAHSILNKVKSYGMTFFVRQGGKNTMYLTIRKTNVTDSFKKQCLIVLAFFISLITPSKKIIILYEKENNRYEESASVLYEKLIDKGYKNVYFIIRKDSPQVVLIKDKYKKNIIYSHTFKHYYKFFKCKSFIGTEALQHVFELRVVSRLVMFKIVYGKLKYLFLQHGVMYMISLNSTSRTAFQKGKGIPRGAHIVVSSQKEANHFLDHGGFNKEDLYISGLPKFDKAVQNKNADKIVIMPTWRPWEYNSIITNYKNTGYYKMIMDMINSVPEELKDKICVLPHPLILAPFLKTDLKKYIPEIISYDLILKTCKLLITDYSSIAYDAFYRGINVIFWWKDKDYCMEKYEATLMLSEKEAFGDICYNKNELRESIEKNYNAKQSQKNIKRYHTIVEFTDNKNTNRLIKMLEKDNFI